MSSSLSILKQEVFLGATEYYLPIYTDHSLCQQTDWLLYGYVKQDKR